MDPRDGMGATTDAAPAPVVPPELAPGAVIAGRYCLEARLGGGGGGTVWRCRDDQLRATVALKIVAPGGDVERWRREVAMARRIADRHVCRVHDLGEAAELRFVTMELIEGASLRDRIRRGMSAAEARGLFAQVVAGAAAIHAAGVVHRDLKPDNVVVAADGRAVIVDFGLAREPGPGGAAVTHTGVAVGTPRYMSPEQAAGEPVEARSDVWALGLIGHELLTGRLPGLAGAEPGREIGREIARAGAPRAIGAVLGRCLALDPDARYADARQLQAALATAGRRRRAPIALAAVVVATAVTAALVARSGDRGRGTDPVAPATGDAERFPVLGEPEHWPRDAATSVAVSRDGTRFAYTTAGGELRVQAIAPGAAAETWTVPRYRRTPGAFGDGLITLWCAGWFSDGSLAVLGTSFRDGFHLFRVDRGGGASLLHSQAARFSAAVASDDRAVIGIAGAGVFALPAGRPPDQILALGPGEAALALAVSPDGRQVAVARQAAPGEPVRIEIVAPGGVREVWRGSSAARHDSLLVWLDGARIAFTRREPSGATALYTLDTSGPGEPRERGRGGFGSGSAAGGTVLAVLGSEVASVEIGNARAEQLAPVEAHVAASRVAGWTADGRLVYARGEPAQIARAVPGGGAEPWPGTRAGVEIPDTVDGDSVIAHRLEPAGPPGTGTGEIVVERIDPAGRHRELARLPGDRAADTPVRCAGDRARPCMLQEITGGDVRWIEIDPATGARGRVLHTRGLGDRTQRDAALSVDGKLLAIVEGTAEVIVVDPGAGTTRRYPAGGDAALSSAAFGPTGDIWATSVGFHGHRFGVMAFELRPRSGEYWMATSRGSPSQLALSALSRPAVSPDGSRVAVAVRELHPQVVRIQGL